MGAFLLKQTILLQHTAEALPSLQNFSAWRVGSTLHHGLRYNTSAGAGKTPTPAPSLLSIETFRGCL